MTQLYFDTLNYANMLEIQRISNPKGHTLALQQALSENIYSKPEVDKMIEDTFQRFDKQFRESQKIDQQRFEESLRRFDESQKVDRERFDERTVKMQLEMKEIRNQIDKVVNRHIYKSISILGTLIVVVGAIATFAHNFVH